MTALATLDEVHAWLKSASQTFLPGDDALLNALITRVSVMILDYISLPDVVKRSVSETRNGTNSRAIMLREWPVLSVSAVSCDGINIPASVSQIDSGFLFNAWDGKGSGQSQALMLRGYCFGQGFGNALIQYVAGYVISGEVQVIPGTPFSVTATQSQGTWLSAESVVYADTGIALTQVASAPAANQYSVAKGVYTFNVANVGRSVKLEYSYSPAALAQACVEWVAERYSYRTRVGQISRTQGSQETTSFSLKDMPDFIKAALQDFVRVVPC